MHEATDRQPSWFTPTHELFARLRAITPAERAAMRMSLHAERAAARAEQLRRARAAQDELHAASLDGLFPLPVSGFRNTTTAAPVPMVPYLRLAAREEAALLDAAIDAARHTRAHNAITLGNHAAYLQGFRERTAFPDDGAYFRLEDELYHLQQLRNNPGVVAALVRCQAALLGTARGNLAARYVDLTLAASWFVVEAALNQDKERGYPAAGRT